MSKRARLAAVAASATLLVVGGAAYATIPSNNVINACYTKSGGLLRVVDSTVTTCNKSETSLAWNVQGPKGDRGEPGPQGEPGISLFANVNANGVLISGTAISVERTSTNRYNVRFNRNVSQCAATANVGSTGTPVVVASGAAPVAQTGLIGDDVVRVSFWDGSTFDPIVPTDFKLIVVC